MNSQSKVLNLNSELQHFNIPLEQSNNLKNLKKNRKFGNCNYSYFVCHRVYSGSHKTVVHENVI